MSAPPAHRFFRSLRDTNWPAVEFVKSPDTCVAAFQYWCLQFFSVFPSTPAFRSASGPSPSGFCRPGSFTVGQKSGSGAGSMRGLSQGCLREQRSDLRGSATCVFHRIADFRDPREQTGHMLLNLMVPFVQEVLISGYRQAVSPFKTASDALTAHRKEMKKPAH